MVEVIIGIIGILASVAGAVLGIFFISTDDNYNDSARGSIAHVLMGFAIMIISLIGFINFIYMIAG